MDINGRQSAILPPIESWRSRIAQEEHAQHKSRRDGLPPLDTTGGTIPRSSSPYRAPYHHHSDNLNSTITTSAAAQSLASFAQRRSSGDVPDRQNTNAQSSRYSLPSLYEALGLDKGSPRATTNATSTPVLTRNPQALEPTSPASHTSQAAQNAGYAMQDRDPGSAWNASRTPYLGHIGPASPVPKTARLQHGSSSTSPRLNQHESQLYTHPATNHHNIENRNNPLSHQQQYAQISLHRRRSSQRSKDSSTPPYAPTSVPQQSSQLQPRPSGDLSRPKGIQKSSKPPYGESVKRHLEVFDLEQALNGVHDASKQLVEFSDFYRQKAHQTQRTGPLPGSTPHIQEIDDMMEHGASVQDALNRIREVVVTQQEVLAERSRESIIKPPPQVPDDHEGLHDEAKDGGHGVSDQKRRRGRAAPPGRCHSCNRAETPEWRRGPDGARTLCNACGLHYAKLTRKMGANKSSTGSSNLRPKVLGSPTSVT